MKRLRIHFAVAALLASSLACHPQASFPSVVTDFPEIERFPGKIAGFDRGQVVAYSPELSSFSVAYNHFDEQLQNAVTIYFGPRQNDTTAQLRDEKAAVGDAHPDGRVVSERVLMLEKDGRTYEATLIAFEYTETFAFRLQKVRSLLLVTFTDQKRVKVRSTAPVDQEAHAESKLTLFLEGVSWAGCCLASR